MLLTFPLYFQGIIQALDLPSFFDKLWSWDEKLIRVSDAERALVAPYLTLMTEDAPQRDYPLREVFHGLR